MAETSSKGVNNNSKTRKSRNDHIRTTVGYYLKKKNYTAAEKFRKSDLLLTQDSKQFIFNKEVEADLSSSNSFLYSNVLCLSKDHSIVEHQFTKFVQFVNAQRNQIKEELSNLFGPLMCHLYIELLKGREWKPAGNFLRNHAHLIAAIENLNAPLPNKLNGCSINSNVHEESSASFPTATTQIIFVNESTGSPIRDHFRELIQSLSLCLRIEATENIDIIVDFRSGKYEVDLSLAALNCLRHYLEKHGHIVLMHILKTWIHVEICDAKNDEDNDDSSMIISDQTNDEIDQDAVPNNIMENGIDYREVKKIKAHKPIVDSCSKSGEHVQKLPASSSSLILRRLQNEVNKMQKIETHTRSFKIFNSDRQLTSASLDANECHLSAGFDNSIIKLWQLNQSTCRGKNIYRSFKEQVCEWNAYYTSDDSSSDDENVQKFSRIPTKRSKRAKFNEYKCDENSFNESGGITLFGHSKGVTDTMFSANHEILISVSKDRTIRVWKGSDYTCRGVYRGHNYPIWCVSESPVGMYIATGSMDLTARLWSLDREIPLMTYVGHKQDVDCIAFHPNGNYIATGSTDLTVRLWCVSSGKLFRVFTDCHLPISCVAFSPDGKLLAAAGEETKIRIFDLAGGSQISELKDHTASVTSICWNRSGTKFASCCADGSVRAWDTTKIIAPEQNTQTTTTSSNTVSSSSSSSNTASRFLCCMSGCSRAVNIMFNQDDTISCLGGV